MKKEGEGVYGVSFEAVCISAKEILNNLGTQEGDTQLYHATLDVKKSVLKGLEQVSIQKTGELVDEYRSEISFQIINVYFKQGEYQKVLDFIFGSKVFMDCTLPSFLYKMGYSMLKVTQKTGKYSFHDIAGLCTMIIEEMIKDVDYMNYLPKEFTHLQDVCRLDDIEEQFRYIHQIIEDYNSN